MGLRADSRHRKHLTPVTQVRVCREPEAVQAEREATQNYLRDLQRPGPHKVDG